MIQNLSTSSFRHYLDASLTAPHAPVGVALIGTGGNGGPVLTELARMHVALRALGHAGLHVYAFDDDRVEEPNIGRQLFSRAEKGRNKAEALVTRVNCFFDLRWEAYPWRVDKENIGELAELCRRRNLQIVITAVDNAETRLLIWSSLRHVGPFYFLDIGNSRETGQCILGVLGGVIKQPRRAGCIGYLPTTVDLYPDIGTQDKEERQGPSCSIKEALEKQDLFINRIVAEFAVELLWKGFREGYITVHGVYVNLKTMHVRPLPVDPATWERMGWVYRKRKAVTGRVLKAA
ncbi:MAG: PRTRC system ThiF family protein [Nitrospiraceae bacterium]|nr:PRTRC system ThiF family protein [Nitrospiraceae bacterium]